jgi:hypothetical protein
MGGPSEAEACIPCQHVKTRAISTFLRPNQTLIMVKAELPKGGFWLRQMTVAGTWIQARCRGRCWEPRKRRNPYRRVATKNRENNPMQSRVPGSAALVPHASEKKMAPSSRAI